jgi:hypothetical protein
MNYLQKFYQATGYKTSDDAINSKLISTLSNLDNMSRIEQESFVKEYYSGEYVSLVIWMLNQPFDPQ